MAIKTKLNSEDQYIGEMKIGQDDEKVRVHKVITKINGVKKIIYMYAGQGDLKYGNAEGYIFVNSADTSQLIATKDFYNFNLVYDGTSEIEGLIYQDDVLYFRDGYNTACICTDHEIVNTYPITYSQSLGRERDHYALTRKFDGKYYRFYLTQGTDYASMLYLLVSENGYEWTVVRTNLSGLVGYSGDYYSHIYDFGFITNGTNSFLIVSGGYFRNVNTWKSVICCADIEDLTTFRILVNTTTEEAGWGYRGFVNYPSADSLIVFDTDQKDYQRIISVNNSGTVSSSARGKYYTNRYYYANGGALYSFGNGTNDIFVNETPTGVSMNSYVSSRGESKDGGIAVFDHQDNLYIVESNGTVNYRSHTKYIAKSEEFQLTSDFEQKYITYIPYTEQE